MVERQTYMFRLKFRVSHAPAFMHDGETLELPLGRHTQPAILAALTGGRIRDATVFTVKCGGFASDAVALAAGEQTRCALRLALAAMPVGLDIADRPGTLSFGRVVVDEAREKGIELRPDYNGLEVYPDWSSIRFVSIEMRAVVSGPLDAFLDSFAKAYRGNPTVDEDVSLALELFGLSFFESSLRARFVTLISAMESAVHTKPRSSEAQQQVAALIEATESSTLAESEKKTLVAALRNLKRESITSACRTFVERHGRPGDAEVWQKCHNARHKMVHEGQAPHELPALLPDLESLARRVLLTAALGEQSDTP